MPSWSHLLLRFRVSWVGADVPSLPPRTLPLFTHAGQMRCWASRIGLQDKPSRQLVLNGSSRGAPKQWIHRWPQRCQNRHWGCSEVTYSTESAHSAKNDVERLPYAGKNPLQVPMRINCLVSPKFRICSLRSGRLQSDFPEKLPVDRPVLVGQRKVLNLQPFGSVLDPFRGRCCSSCTVRLARSKKSLISAYRQYSGAYAGITFAFDMQYPRTVRTCHSVADNRHRTYRCRHDFQFSGIQNLFADHVHRRTRVHN